MAQNYLIDSLSKYNETVATRYGASAFGVKDDRSRAATTGDSDQRNYIAETMQWMNDNHIDMGESTKNFESFMSLVSSKASSNEDFKFGEGGLFWVGNEKQIGKEELRAMANMMLQLNEMQTSGQITMDQYTAHMQTLFSQETMDSLANGGKGDFMVLAQSVDDDNARDIDQNTKDSNKIANEQRMSVQKRAVINDVNDYAASRAERLGDDAPTYSSQTEARDAMYNALYDAHENGTIEDGPYNDMIKYLQGGFGSASSTTNEAGQPVQTAGNYAVAAYALEEALNSGNPNVIMMFTDPETLKNIQSGNTKGLQALSELDLRVGGKSAAETPAVSDDLSKEQTDKDAITKGVVYMKGQGLFDEKDADGSYPGVNMLVDTMTANYFSPADGNGPGITQDEYLSKYDEYAKLDQDAQLMYLVNNPEFAKADAAVNSIQRVADQMNEALGDNGNIYNMTNILYDAANDGFNNNLDSLVTAMTTIGEGKVASAEYTGDYDAEMKMEDARTLLQRDPMSSYELVVATSQEIWQGGNHYGTGWENRINAMMDKGLTREEAERVKDIVNMGYDVTSSMTQEKYDELFAAKDGGTLSERMDAYVANAEKMMTYEGGGDYMFQNNAGEGSMMSYAEATQAYANAAKAVERYQEGGGELSEEVKEEVGTNLEAFIADGAKAFAENAKNADPIKASRPDIDPNKDKDDFQMQ